MNVADFFIGFGAGLGVIILPVLAAYLAVKRILTRDPKVAIRFAFKHMGGMPGVPAAARETTIHGENGLANSPLLQFANDGRESGEL